MVIDSPYQHNCMHLNTRINSIPRFFSGSLNNFSKIGSNMNPLTSGFQDFYSGGGRYKAQK